MEVENARANKIPSGEYVATMTRPSDGQIYSEKFGGADSACKYARHAVEFGWNVEVVGPDSKIYFVGAAK